MVPDGVSRIRPPKTALGIAHTTSSRSLGLGATCPHVKADHTHIHYSPRPSSMSSITLAEAILLLLVHKRCLRYRLGATPALGEIELDTIALAV